MGKGLSSILGMMVRSEDYRVCLFMRSCSSFPLGFSLYEPECGRSFCFFLLITAGSDVSFSLWNGLTRGSVVSLFSFFVFFVCPYFHHLARFPLFFLACV